MTEPRVSGTSDRLRDAYHAVVEAVQPDDIGDLRSPQPLPRIAGFARWTRRLTPLAAAAAVVLAVGAAVAIPRLAGHGTAAVTAPQTAGASGGQPPFLVDLVRATDLSLQVRDAATGRVLTQLKPPEGGGRWVAVAATGNPARFVVGATYLRAPGVMSCTSSQNYTQLYTLTLTAAGVPASLSPLYRIPVQFDTSVPGGGSALAVSADGRTVAYATAPCGRRTSKTQMSMVVIRDGVSRTWTTPWLAGPSSLSLSADGSELGYADVTQYEWPISPLGSAWILPTGSPPGSAARWSRKLLSNVPRAGIQITDEELSPDGTIMYVVTATEPGNNPNQPETDALYAYSTATGARLRTLHSWNGTTSGPPSLTIGGDEALVWDMYNWVDEVNLTTGSDRTFTQLPHGGANAERVFAVAW
jgi:hypothetical protein